MLTRKKVHKMPATLDQATALVLIDLQHGITALPTVHPSEQIVARCARLAIAFRANGKLIAATRVAFARDGGDVIKTRTAESPADGKPVPDYGELRTEMGLTDHDILITKHGWNAFYGTQLDLELRRRKITGIVLAGISTSIGVESTARAANEGGYELTIVTDAITDTDEGAHRNSLTAIFPRIAELATTDEILAVLAAPSGAPSFAPAGAES
jgi:nicotinamidase-related amidase